MAQIACKLPPEAKPCLSTPLFTSFLSFNQITYKYFKKLCRRSCSKGNFRSQTVLANLFSKFVGYPKNCYPTRPEKSGTRTPLLFINKNDYSYKIQINNFINKDLKIIDTNKKN